MLRASTLVALALATIGSTSGSAAAQSSFFPPTFDPPLAAPAPLSSPTLMALRPGSRAECASREWVEGDVDARPAQAQAVISVEAAGDGVRMRVAEPQYGVFEYEIAANAAGDVRVEGARRLGETAPDAQTLASDLAFFAPELRLHGRQLAEGDPLYDPEELARAFARMTDTIGGAVATPRVTGNQVLRGESIADGRRVLVFETNITLVAAPQGLTIGVIGRAAFDAATGLRLYADHIIEVTSAPEGRQPVRFAVRQEVVCQIDAAG